MKTEEYKRMLSEGGVVFDEDTMAQHENIVMAEQDIDRISLWNAEPPAVLEEWLKSNIKLAILTLLAGCYVDPQSDGITLYDCEHTPIMCWPWKEVLEWPGFEDRDQYQQALEMAINGMTKVGQAIAKERPE